VELGVEPAQLGQLDQRIDGPGGFPVDERDRHSAPGDDVPWGDVTVADHLDRAAQVPAVPGKPDRGRWWPEGAGRLVQVPQQAAQRGSSFQAPGTRLGELAADECQLLAPIGIEA
jgi:hypothetical protein